MCYINVLRNAMFFFRRREEGEAGDENENESLKKMDKKEKAKHNGGNNKSLLSLAFFYGAFLFCNFPQYISFLKNILLALEQPVYVLQNASNCGKCMHKK